MFPFQSWYNINLFIYFRWKMNCLVLSKPSVISSTDGLVALLIYSEKWPWRFWETRYSSSYLLLEVSSPFRVITKNVKPWCQYWLFTPIEFNFFIYIFMSLLTICLIMHCRKSHSGRSFTWPTTFSLFGRS